jgi:two-component system LytT family response regulator
MKLKELKKYLLIEDNQGTIEMLQNALSEFKNWNCVGVVNTVIMANKIVMNKHPDVIFIQIDSLFNNLEQVVSILRYNSELDVKFIGISSTEDPAYELIKMNFYELILTPINRIEVKKILLKFERIGKCKAEK